MSDELEKQISEDLKLQKRWFTFLFNKKVPPVPTDEERKVYPESSVNLISRSMFWWLNSLLLVGYKRTLQYKDFFKMDNDQKNGKLHKQFSQNLQKYLKKSDDKKITRWLLFKSLYDTLIFDFWAAIILRTLSDVASTLSPLLLKKLTNFVESIEFASDKHYGKGVGYAIGCSLLMFFSSITVNYSFFRAAILGAKVRCILTREILGKSFVIDAKGSHKFPSGQINSFMSTDLNRIDRAMIMAMVSVGFPIPLIISIALLIVNLGVSALAGLACFVMAFCFLAFSFKLLMKLRKNTSEYTDIRVNLTKEFLKNFKMIKFYSWEESYRQRIEDARNQEMDYTLSIQTIKNILLSITTALPNISSMVAFLTVSKVSPNKSAGSIFSSLSLFEAISTIFFILPMAVSSTVDANVGLLRITEFLSCDNLNVEQYKIEDVESDNFAIKVDNCDFEWEIFEQKKEDNEVGNFKKEGRKGEFENKKLNQKDKTEKQIIKLDSKTSISASSDSILSTMDKTASNFLKNVNLEIYKGEFVVVAGSIGSGKSSLLSALSGFMKRTKGKIYKSGDSILCGLPWIKNDSVRENILFGLPYDENKYNKVVEVCCLTDDFNQFLGGDMTEIGERGITLSGGQKARITLARCIYADKDIIYLDDVLSAVDARVGKHIVNKCICEYLGNKTVILATHQIGLVKKANRLIFLNGDGTVDIGTFDELETKNSKVKKFFKGVAEENVNDNQNMNKNINKSYDNIDIPIKNSNEKIVKIVGDEEKAVNSFSRDIYKNYYSLGIGIFKFAFFPLFISLIILSTFSNYFSNTWLSFWMEDKFKYRSRGFYIGLYVLFNFLYTIFLGLEFVLIGYFCTTASRKLNIGAMRRILYAPVVFMDISPLGRVLNRFTKDTDVLDNEISDQVKMAIYPLGMMVGSFVLCIIYLPWFAIAVPILLFLYLFITSYYQASGREIKRIDAVKRSFVYTHFNETLEGSNTIKSYNRKNFFLDEINTLLDNNNEAYFLTWAVQRWLGSNFAFITFFFILIISLLCCFRIFNISSTSTGLLLSYSMNVPNMLSLAIRCLTQIETEFNSVERLNFYSKHLIQEAKREIPESDPPSQWPQNGNIEFKNVSLKYRPELPYSIKDLNLSIKGNEKVGFCGRTGAGKSTFMTCLYRLTEFEGCITIDDVDISKIGLHSLRKKLTIIPQDPVLFVGNIRSNIDPFDDYRDDELWEVLVTAGLIDEKDIDGVKRQTGEEENKNYHKFHLQRNVEDNGSNFSLGERQLIALCRALVRKTKILILDEATSNVDYETDERIQRTIATHFKDCTILSIAHRLKTILTFDKIVVMDNGRVVQFGTPKELFAEDDGLFKILCQQSGIKDCDFMV